MASKAKRGRPKSRRVEDKADKAETRRAEPSQRPLLEIKGILHHFNTIKGYNDKINSLSGHRRKAFETMKAEGIDPAMIRDLIAAEKADPLALRDYHEQLAQGLKAIDAPFQLTVFDTAFGSPEAQAKAEGRAQANAGRAAECRWPDGTPEHEAYMKEYSRVQARMVAGADKLSDEEIERAIA